MALLDGIFNSKLSDEEEAVDEVVERTSNAASAEYQDLKSRVHNRLFDYLDLSRLSEVSERRIAGDIALLTRRVLSEEKALLTQQEREKIVSEIQHEVFGLGPLEPLLADHGISDILVNGYDDVYIERDGVLERTVARFKDNAHLMRIIEKIVSGVGRRVDELTPYVDARLEDGSRVNVIIPPLALDGPILSIRRFSTRRFTYEDLVAFGTLTPEVVELLQGIVKGRLNVMVSGGTGVGKTTLLNVLSGFIPREERIVTIEDSAELQLKQDHVVRLETRLPNVEGKGEVTQRDLVINSLRMRPDRIIMGEVRGGEALDMLQAMNTGHDGSLTTVHANTPLDAVSRLETMVAMTGLDLPQRVVRGQITSAIAVILQLTRLRDGSRKMVSLVELVGMEENGELAMSEIFRLNRRGFDESGRALGEIIPTGVVPEFMSKLTQGGVSISPTIFKVPTLAEVANE